MSDRAKVGLAVIGAAGVAVVVGLWTGGGEEPRPMRGGGEAYRVAGVNLAAARGCAEVPGCTADVWAQLPDGGTVRLVVRALDGGTMAPLDGGAAMELDVDGGVLQ